MTNRSFLHYTIWPCTLLVIISLLAVVIPTHLGFQAALAEESPELEWQKTFGNPADGTTSYAESVQQTADGGYVMAGATSYSAMTAYDAWLIKTDASGNKQWDKTFGGSDYDDFCSVQQTVDGGYALAGTTRTGAGGSDVWLAKTDSLGNKQWDKTFGGSGGDGAYSMRLTADGGYIVAGVTTSYGAGRYDFWLIKADASGNKQWDKTFGGSSVDFARSVQQTADGGYIVAGYTDPYGDLEYDVWLIKTDPLGNRQWDKTFGDAPSNDTASSVQQTADGGYVVAGHTYSYSNGIETSAAWLIKTDSLGNKQWDKTFGGLDGGAAYFVQQTVDGGYIMAARRQGTADWDGWLIKADASGNRQWDIGFGGTSDDYVSCVHQTADGGYILTGQTYSYRSGGCDAWLIKAAPGAEPPPEITITDIRALFPEEVVSYNPLLPPDAVYLYYDVAYSADSQYWKEGDTVDTSGFSLTANGQPVQAEGCKVFKTSGQDGSYQATLQFEVPFRAEQNSYNLSGGGFSASTVVTAQTEPIKVNDEFTTYARVGAGLIAGAKVDLGSGLLGGKLKGEASALSGGIFGRASGGFESEISYSGVGSSEDYIIVGFPLSAEAGLEGSLVKMEAEGNVLPKASVDATIVDAGSLSVAGYGSFISYPVKANLEDDADLISAFIIPIAANSLTGSPALLLKIAGMADPLLPWDIYSPYKGIDRYGFTFSPSAEILSLDISCGVAGKTEMFSNTLSLLDISGEFDSFWEDGQENGSTVDTHTFTGEGGVAFWEYENADEMPFPVGKATYEKTGQDGPDNHVVVTGGEPGERILEEGELCIRQWELDADNYAKLYDENGHFSLKNLPRLYETDTIRGVTYYQPKPGTFHMDVLEVEVGAGLSGEVKIGADLEHKMRVPMGTTYASFGVVYPVSEVSPASIRGNIDKVDQYAGNSLEVLKDSLATNAEAVKGWMKEIVLGLSTNVVATVNEAADQLSVVAQETGEAIAEVATQAYGAAQDFAVSVWEGRFNPDAAIDNANLEFASKVILVEQGSGQPVPDGTTATIHPNADVAPEELSDAGVYTFRDGTWKYVPSVPNQDGSHTFALTANGYYALIHAFPVDPLPLQQSPVSMAPGSSTMLTSDVVRNGDGSVAANAVFSIDLLEGATIASDGTSIAFGESPITFPESATTDSNGRLSIPIDAGTQEGEACLAIRSASGYSSQVARVVVSAGAGTDNDFTVAIKMVQPAEGMAPAGQPVTLQALTTYASSDIRWVIVDQFGNEERPAGESITFAPSYSGIYEVYCFAKDANGFAHLAYAQVPVTDPSNDTDADGMSDDIEDVYGTDPQTPDTEVLLGGLEENRAPVADAGSGYTGSAQSAISFSALASYDPDYDPLEYHWGFGDGTTGTGISPAHTYLNKGEYVVTLTVTDDSGLIATATASAVVGYPRWDINQSSKVDYKDLAILGAHYGETTAAPHPAWDIHQDGTVNYKDLAILGAHYGETY